MSEDNQRLLYCFLWAIGLTALIAACAAISQARADECRAKGGELVYVSKAWLCVKSGTVIE